MSRADLALFAHLVKRPEAELDLARAALVIAEPSYPGLDIAYYIGQLDRLGDEARRRVADLGPSDGEARVRRLLRLLFQEVGFEGNQTDYYDPRNSFLNEVIERRTGIPITLSLVVIEVARRADIEAVGVGFPGHFLVRVTSGAEPIFLDAFHGRVLSPADLRTLNAQATGSNEDPAPRLLHPASKAQILTRMLHNLRAIYQSRSNAEGERAVLERLNILTPGDDEIERALERLNPTGGGDGGGGGSRMN